MGVLIDADRDNYGSQSTEFFQLGMNDVSDLNQRRLNVSQIGLAAESVDSLKLRQVRPPAQSEREALDLRSCALEVDIG